MGVIVLAFVVWSIAALLCGHHHLPPRPRRPR